MTTFGKKLGPRVNALKEIGENLLELLWLLFSSYQWIVALGLPLALAGAAIGLMWGKPVSLGLYDTSMLSATGIVLTCVTFGVYAGFAYYYMFKIRKRDEPTFGYKCTIMALYVSILLMLTYRIELAEYQYVQKNIRYSETTVWLFDADTKKPLKEGGYIGPGSISHSVWQTKYSTLFTPDSSFKIQLIDIEPMQVGFTAPGYKTQHVLVGKQEGEETLNVYLQKNTLPDPNGLTQ